MLKIKHIAAHKDFYQNLFHESNSTEEAIAIFSSLFLQDKQ
jgi:poly-beta-hydroxyalkanoate depolymerase